MKIDNIYTYTIYNVTSHGKKYQIRVTKIHTTILQKIGRAFKEIVVLDFPIVEDELELILENYG